MYRRVHAIRHTSGLDHVVRLHGALTMSPAETWGLVLTGIPIALAVGGLILRAVVSHWTTPLREECRI